MIISDNTAYVVDCGDGVARQLAIAGVPLNALRHVFITHHHSDHDAGYGNLIWLAWTAGLNTPVDAWGPPPLEPLVHVHEIRDNGPVMSDANVRVTAALVNHPPVVPAFGYRFDGHDRSIVISGDTAPSDNLVKLARDADVLVHSVMYPAAIDRLVGRVPNAAKFRCGLRPHSCGSADESSWAAISWRSETG